MMGKFSCILLAVATLVVLVAGDCIEDAINNPGLMGGYQPIKDPENDANVKKIVADGIELRNTNMHNKHGVRYIDDDHYVAFHQIVNGENYCCQFRTKTGICNDGVGCENSPPPKSVCSIKAFKAFDENLPKIDESSLHCIDLLAD